MVGVKGRVLRPPEARGTTDGNRLGKNTTADVRVKLQRRGLAERRRIRRLWPRVAQRVLVDAAGFVQRHDQLGAQPVCGRGDRDVLRDMTSEMGCVVNRHDVHGHRRLTAIGFPDENDRAGRSRGGNGKLGVAAAHVHVLGRGDRHGLWDVPIGMVENQRGSGGNCQVLIAGRPRRCHGSRVRRRPGEGDCEFGCRAFGHSQFRIGYHQIEGDLVRQEQNPVVDDPAA